MHRIIKKLINLIFAFSFVVCGTNLVQGFNHVQGYNADLDFNIIIFDSDLYTYYLESDVPPFIINETAMIPLRAFAEAFGYSITGYQVKDKKITISDKEGKSEWILFIDSPEAIKNGNTTTFSQVSVIRNNRTFIPLQYVSAFFGKYVKDTNKENGFIWITPYQFLTNEDVAVENDNNYYVEETDEQGIDYRLTYILKTNGQTYRGIKIGDPVEKLVELYGEPRGIEFWQGKMYYKYTTIGWPGESPGDVDAIFFYIENNMVDNVIVFH